MATTAQKGSHTVAKVVGSFEPCSKFRGTLKPNHSNDLPLARAFGCPSGKTSCGCRPRPLQLSDLLRCASPSSLLESLASINVRDTSRTIYLKKQTSMKLKIDGVQPRVTLPARK